MNAVTYPQGNPHLWFTQLRAIIGIELGRVLFTSRATAIYVVAAVPIILLTTVGYIDNPRTGGPITGNIANARYAFAVIYAGFLLGTMVFLGSASLFISLFRGEILDRSLHYYLLSPVRREILAAGKYLAGLIASIGLFGTVTLVCYLLLYLPYGVSQMMSDFSSGPAARELTLYLLTTVFACIGYGAVFLLLGLFFRNPIFPILVLIGWELMHFILPPALKMISVVHYLKGIMPPQPWRGPIAVVMASPPAAVCMLALTGLTAVALILTVLRLKRIELRYTDS
jgi:ABC-type transport system involved in multi-copper enzyme maturation permease subunit